MDDNKIIIVKKKKVRGGGHHGGSWKVAYADFVTAMMAFFLVMWIVGMDSDVKDLVQGYFNNPIGYRRAFGAGVNPVSQGATPLPTEFRRMPLFVRQVEQRRFNAIRDGILQELEGLTGSEDFGSQVEVVLTPDGLRIELVEAPGSGTFFALGSDQVQPAAQAALAVVAGRIGEIPNPVVIEGHTDAATFGAGDYTNWELSTDRANAARRILQSQGLDPQRIQEVRGLADRHPRVPDNPLDPANRRVTILIPYLDPVDTGDDMEGVVIGG